MRTASLLLATASVLGILACSDATGPQRSLRPIYQIHVPASAAATDSIHISFMGNIGQCDNDVMVSSSMNDTGMTFSVSAVSGGACQPGYPPGTYVEQQPYSYIVIPPHAVPFTVSFAEPGQADSARVVGAP